VVRPGPKNALPTTAFAASVIERRTVAALRMTSAKPNMSGHLSRHLWTRKAEMLPTDYFHVTSSRGTVILVASRSDIGLIRHAVAHQHQGAGRSAISGRWAVGTPCHPLRSTQHG
jgi:hypothetical protein